MIRIFTLSIQENWTIVHQFSSDTTALIALKYIHSAFSKETLRRKNLSQVSFGRGFIVMDLSLLKLE
jgi:hypothetical protein